MSMHEYKHKCVISYYPQPYSLNDIFLKFLGKGYSLRFYWSYEISAANLLERYLYGPMLIVMLLSMLPFRVLILAASIRSSFPYVLPHLLFYFCRGNCEQPWWTHVKLLCTARCSSLWEGRFMIYPWLLVFGYLMFDFGVIQTPEQLLSEKVPNHLIPHKVLHNFSYYINCWKLLFLILILKDSKICRHFLVIGHRWAFYCPL